MQQELHQILHDIVRLSIGGDHIGCSKKALKAIELLGKSAGLFSDNPTETKGKSLGSSAHVKTEIAKLIDAIRQRDSKPNVNLNDVTDVIDVSAVPSEHCVNLETNGDTSLSEASGSVYTQRSDPTDPV